MICAWKELLAILPGWLKHELQENDATKLQELRLRINAPPELNMGRKSRWLNRNVTQSDLSFVINTASRYSPWNATSMASGFITAPGGHRIGICGEAICQDGHIIGIRQPTSLCIRVAKDFSGIAEKLSACTGSVLILGAPNWGKTTLLRDLIRQRSAGNEHVAVIDSRGELFPVDAYPKGKCTDVLIGCPKAEGIDMALRTLGPQIIAMDEITAADDCQALLQAAWCGVSLLATAHAASLNDFYNRKIYAPLVSGRIFDHIVVLHPDKSWHLERSAG